MRDARSEAHPAGEWARTRPVGELDPPRQAELKDQVTSLVDRGDRRIVIDLTDVEMLKPEHLVTLAGIQRRILATNGELHLTWRSARVGEVVLIADLHGALGAPVRP